MIKARSRPPGFDEGVLAAVDRWWEGWSLQDVEWEVRANLVYRQFTRVGAGKVPDAKALGRQAQALGPEVIQKLQECVVDLAHENKIVTGRKLRVDTAIVETNIHYPTDSSLLGDGVRVLTRVMQRVTELAGEVGTKLRDRSRSVQRRVVEIARVSRSKSQQSQERMKDLYSKLLEASGRVARQAQRFVQEIVSGVKRSADIKKQAALEGRKQELETMLGRVKQVRRQARARVFGGNTHMEGKLVSVF